MKPRARRARAELRSRRRRRLAGESVRPVVYIVQFNDDGAVRVDTGRLRTVEPLKFSVGQTPDWAQDGAAEAARKMFPDAEVIP